MKKMLLTTLAIASLAAGGMAVHNGARHAGIVTANNLGTQYNQGSTQQSQTASASRGEVRDQQLANNLYPAYNHETA